MNCKIKNKINKILYLLEIIMKIKINNNKKNK